MKQTFKKQETGYTQIKNSVILDKGLSLKAKGLYTYLFSKPDDWDFAYNRIAEELGEGQKTIRAGLKELEDIGYLQRVKRGTGRVDYYLNYDKKPRAQNRHQDKDPGAQKGKEPLGQVAETGTVSNTDNTSNTDVESNIDGAEAQADANVEKIGMKQVQEIIDAFKPVNESYKTLYGKKTEYNAAKDLIKTYPKEHILGMLKVMPDYNKIQYLSAYEKVYTPLQLLKNWSVVKDNLIRLKIKKSKEREVKPILR